jgi:prephenate dehydrogenase
MLGDSQSGTKSAHAELFLRATMMVVASPRTTPEMEDLALNVTRLLGAKPMLTDAVEADGIMTTAHLLPQLTAAALIEASKGTAGWQEARKLAGRPFAAVTGGMAYFDDPVSIGTAASSNPARVVHGLDVLIAALSGLRDTIGNGEHDEICQRLKQSYRARESWLDERNDAEWLTEGNEPVELPGLGEHLTRLFFGGRIAEATRGPTPRRSAKK